MWAFWDLLKLFGKFCNCHWAHGKLGHHNLLCSVVCFQVVSGNVLLVSDGYVQAYKAVQFFLTTSPVVIGLAGAPGEEGVIRLSSAGQLSSSQLILDIPFRLRPCHTGFTQTPFMSRSSEVCRTYTYVLLYLPPLLLALSGPTCSLSEAGQLLFVVRAHKTQHEVEKPLARRLAWGWFRDDVYLASTVKVGV